jgi:hypothetical protein
VTSLTTEFSTLWKDMNPKLAGLLVEADKLRSQYGPGSTQESITDLHMRLVNIRGNLDRLEEIVATVGRVRARARMALTETQDQFDDRQAEIINASHIEAFSTATERNAGYQTQMLDHRLTLRRAKRTLAEVEEVYEYVREMHRSLDANRRDIGTRFSMMSFELRMEKS